MSRFADRVAIVTGGASGIGRATAQRLEAEGATVVVADLNAPDPVDVTDAAAVRAFVAGVKEQLGKVDILVSNAGWDRPGPFLETTEDLWDKVIDINYRGHLAVTHAVLPLMIERGYGRVVTVASDAGRVGSSGEVVYSGAKGAVIAFTKAIAREVARHGVNVNCVAPGLVDTPLLDGIMDGNAGLMSAIVRTIPLHRTGKPEEIAAAVCFLASADADYITGQTLSVNGGLTMA